MQHETLISEPIIRNYKDTVFRMIFKEKKELLALYNAVNHTNYTNLEDLEITTLENAIYMSMKNDVSFVVDMVLSLYEHQSTVNPNLPLRDLDYVSRNFAGFYGDKDIYSPKLIQLPNPRFIVFYNGKQKQPAKRELRLSDAYIHSEAEPQLELIVTQLNINPGYNDELMEKCPTLRDYMLYVDRVREHQKTMTLKEAVGRAVDECIKDGILADFLKKNKEQVISMSIFEYDEKLHEETMREIGREEGRIEGKAVGRAEGEAAERATNISRSIASLRATPLTDDQIAEHLVNTFDLTIEQAKQCMQDAESK